jgi:hypothetical protein
MSGAATRAFGRSNTPNAISNSASACAGRRRRASRSASAKASTAATSQMTANRTSRQIMPTRKNAGGVSARNTVARPSQSERRAAMSASVPKPSQYSVAVSRNMLSAPGATGSTSRHSAAMAGDCQSPKCQAWASA